jgi:ribose 5-phosphate isomerase B
MGDAKPTQTEARPIVVGLAADHAGFELKNQLIPALQSRGLTLMDFGAASLDPHDDYPDYVLPLAEAVQSGQVDRGVAICGRGVGACIAANKAPAVRAALIHDEYTARKAAEVNANVICIAAQDFNVAQAADMIQAFLDAGYSPQPDAQGK